MYVTPKYQMHVNELNVHDAKRKDRGTYIKINAPGDHLGNHLEPQAMLMTMTTIPFTLHE